MSQQVIGVIGSCMSIDLHAVPGRPSDERVNIHVNLVNCGARSLDVANLLLSKLDPVVVTRFHVITIIADSAKTVPLIAVIPSHSECCRCGHSRPNRYSAKRRFGLERPGLSWCGASGVYWLWFPQFWQGTIGSGRSTGSIWPWLPPSREAAQEISQTRSVWLGIGHRCVLKGRRSAAVPPGPKPFPAVHPALRAGLISCGRSATKSHRRRSTTTVTSCTPHRSFYRTTRVAECGVRNKNPAGRRGHAGGSRSSFQGGGPRCDKPGGLEHE